MCFKLKHLVILVFSLLSVLSISSMVGVLHFATQYKKQYNGAVELKKEVFLLSEEMERGYKLRSHFSAETLSSLLWEMKIPCQEENNTVYLLIPPFPCQACVNEEFELLRKQTEGAFIVVAEQSLSRNIAVKFQNNKNIRIQTYTGEDLMDELFKSIDQLIYFSVHDGRIVSTFITSKQLGNETIHYYPFSSCFDL